MLQEGQVLARAAPHATQKRASVALSLWQLEQRMEFDSLDPVLLGKSTPNRLLSRLSDGRRRRVEGVVQQFRNAFPEIEYDILWSSRTCNAQAFVDEGGRRVRLYGGLARHKKVSIAAIAWVVAHETGHHLGGPPFHPRFPWISAEQRADAWAASVGLPRVFGRRLARRYTTFGRGEASRAVA